MPVLKVLAVDVERAFLTVIFDEVLMTTTDFMEEQEVFELLGKKKTAVWRLRKEHGFPNPVLTYPSRYSRKAVFRWLEDGGINNICKTQS